MNFLGATTDELLFVLVLTAMVLLGTKIAEVGEVLGRLLGRR